MKKLIIIVIIIIVIIGGWLILSSDNNNTTTTDNLGDSANLDKAPDFSLKDYNGNIVSLADFQGQPIVINSWAVWCPFCVKELPVFSQAQGEFENVTIIAIDRSEPLDQIKAYTDDLGLTDDLVFLLDPKDSFYRSLGGFAMPETIFVNKDGFIVHHKRGPMEIEEIRSKIKDIL